LWAESRDVKCGGSFGEVWGPFLVVFLKVIDATNCWFIAGP